MPSDINLPLIFFTGVTTGGLTCLLVQGGMLTSALSKQNKTGLPLISFLIAKLISYSILGALLGSLGSVFTLSPVLNGYFQIFIALYLVGIALSLLNVHPIFRYFIITPPRFLTRLLKKQSVSDSVFAPALLGAFTVFLPCATTQAIEVIALGSGNPLYGALIMFAFILGTSPTFYVLGFLFNQLQTRFHRWFYKVSAAMLIIMAVLTFNGGLALVGSIYTLQNFYEAAKISISGIKINSVLAVNSGQFQTVAIQANSNGYVPNAITLRRGVPTRVSITTQNTQGCSRSFTIPALGIRKLLPTSGVETVEFTPDKTGPLVFACSMGMYTGTFNVL